MTTYTEFLNLRAEVDCLTEEFEKKAKQLAIIACGGSKPEANAYEVELGLDTVYFQWADRYRGEYDTIGGLIKFPADWMDRPLDEVQIEAQKLIEAKAKAEAEAKAQCEAAEAAQREARDKELYERLRQKYGA